MAKCPVCETRKAKRKCQITDGGAICSLCCGQTRQASSCAGCTFYKPPEIFRKYSDVPAFSVMEMEDRTDLQGYANIIENAIYRFDAETDHTMKDDVPIAIYECLLDKYHFGDENPDSDDVRVTSGTRFVDEAIRQMLPQVDMTTLVKVLSVLRQIAKRRSRGRREYLQVVATYARAVVF